MSLGILLCGLILNSQRTLRREITGQRGEIAGLRGEIAGLRGEIAGLRSDHFEIRSELAQLREFVAPPEKGCVKRSPDGEPPASVLAGRMSNDNDDS